MEYKIKLIRDDEANVWVATSDDIPGLVLESGSFDALIERVRYAIPELLELNSRKAPSYNISFLSERYDRVYANYLRHCIDDKDIRRVCDYSISAYGGRNSPHLFIFRKVRL